MAQHLVPDWMPKPIIDELEMIHIPQHQHKSPSMALPLANHMVEVLVEGTAIEQLREGVSQHFVPERGGLDLQHPSSFPQVMNGGLVLRLHLSHMHPLNGAPTGMQEAGSHQWQRDPI